jgi:hypothetical protein
MKTISQIMTFAYQDLQIQAQSAEYADWQGRHALRLEDGLAVIPDLSIEDASLEVLIGVDGPAYPGIAFRLQDELNFELAYAVPHVSGQWDALQYDPVFHGSNTWQIFIGPGYQSTANVPTGEWFRLRVDFCGSQAAIRVDDQPPLVVERLAREIAAGSLGLWTYRPAYFCDLTVKPLECESLLPSEVPSPIPDLVEAWFLEDYGVVACESNGTLNMNRFLPTTARSARLSRRFELNQFEELCFNFGFSDRLILDIDGKEIFSGEHTFKGFEDRAARGYVEAGMVSCIVQLNPGRHLLSATLEVSEPFGWGIVLGVESEALRWSPPGAVHRKIAIEEDPENT